MTRMGHPRCGICTRCFLCIGTEMVTSSRGPSKQRLHQWGPHEAEVEAALGVFSSTTRSERSERKPAVKTGGEEYARKEQHVSQN